MDELIKDKDVKIAHYGSYISKLVEEIKNLKSKYHNLESTTEIPVKLSQNSLKKMKIYTQNTKRYQMN